jgi:tetrathionate reductase subunit B
MGKALIIDINRCNGCYNCQIACKDEHVGNDWAPYAKPQPDTGQFWMKVTDIVRGTIPKVKVAYMHDICQHCDDAPCIKACGREAIYKRDDGIVIIDPGKCVGGRNCVDACPYGVIYFNDDLNISQKCTFCAHLMDRGWKEPRCVDACPTDALRFGEEEELQEYIKKAEILLPEEKTRPRVYYIGIPKKFVAGAVWDPEKDECTQGAKVTLTGPGENRVATTDRFGDFWFEGLAEGVYSISIEKGGYQSHKIDGISTEKDANLGDIELHAAK